MCTRIKIVDHHITVLISEKAATNLLPEISLVAVLSLTKWFFV